MGARTGAVGAIALAALAAGAPAAAARPALAHERIGRLAAALVTSGPDRGRVVIDVPVRGPGLPRSLAARLRPAVARQSGRVRVTLRVPGRRASVATLTRAFPLILGVDGRPLARVHRFVLSGAAGARIALLADGRRGIPLRARITSRATLVPRPGAGAVRVALARASLPVVVTPSPAAPAPAAPVCEGPSQRVNYARPAALIITCMGEAVTIRAGRAAHGTVSAGGAGAGRLALTYRPRLGFTGPDRVPFTAAGPGGSVSGAVPVGVQPFRLRAIGDSVTAGFGFLPNGAEMGSLDLPFCIPPSVPNNRCSSNSPNGVGASGPVGWLPDFGLSNGVAWPAQFAAAAGLSGDQYQNWAVAGSTPAEWDTGNLNQILQLIVAQNPDLTVMTLGANPLLDIFITGRGEFCAFSANDAQLVQCVQGYVAQQQLQPHLVSVVAHLLQAPANRVVVSEYHLAVPSLNLFSAHQIAVIFQTFNADIAQAVRGMPGFGARVFLMAPPRFDIGLPPGSAICPGGSPSSPVDGPSHQSDITQTLLAADPFDGFCGSPDEWIISPDTGIHPSRAGHAQFAAALALVVAAHGLMPPGAGAAG